VAGDSQPDYRQEAPPLVVRSHPSMMPTCPLCTATNTPGAPLSEQPVSRTPRDEPISERCPFTCSRCWTVFAGTDREWQMMRDDRDAYASVRARLEMLEEA
jgi:hypothetical protein